MTTRIVAMNRPCPRSVNPVHWHQSVGVARQACARIFRDGGTPADALAAFGVTLDADAPAQKEWAPAIEAIADALCSRPVRHAA